jgi:hypothetical protein
LRSPPHAIRPPAFRTTWSFFGESGRGKTFISRRLAEKWDFAYVRVTSHSNASSLFGALVTEMGGYPHYRIEDNFNFHHQRDEAVSARRDFR